MNFSCPNTVLYGVVNNAIPKVEVVTELDLTLYPNRYICFLKEDSSFPVVKLPATLVEGETTVLTCTVPVNTLTVEGAWAIYGSVSDGVYSIDSFESGTLILRKPGGLE